jgi:hypothetical protein
MPIILEPPTIFYQPLPPGAVGGGSTLAQLLQELGERMGDYAAGVASDTSVDLTFLQDSARVEPDNTFLFGWLSYTGTKQAQNTGLERRITGYDGSLNVGRFLLGNGANNSGLIQPALAGDGYEVHMRWSRRRKTAAINRAIRRLPQNFWRRVVDTSVETTPNTWRYLLPPGMTRVFEIWVQASINMSGPGPLGQGEAGTGFPYNRLVGWYQEDGVAPDGSVYHAIQMDAIPPFPRYLRLVGQGVQTVLSEDADVVAAGQDDYDQRLVEYLLEYASAYLWLEGANGAPVDQSARSVDMVKLQMQLATEMRNDLVMPGPPIEIDTPITSVSGRGWGDHPFWMSANYTPPMSSR